MHFLVTCGPTYEPLDKVRRLTNFSTGKLGIGLANHLLNAGHRVTLLKGYYSICHDPVPADAQIFTTTQDLLDRVRAAAKTPIDALFHAAAVSDFGFGAIYKRLANGELEPINSGKFGTRDGNILAELAPTPKIISQLRKLYPTAKIFGWKYEVEGSRESAVALALRQISDNRTNYCVVNGAAYGTGFGIVSEAEPLKHCADSQELYASLLRLATA